jgi:hypothetical protein
MFGRVANSLKSGVERPSRAGARFHAEISVACVYLYSISLIVSRWNNRTAREDLQTGQRISHHEAEYFAVELEAVAACLRSALNCNQNAK